MNGINTYIIEADVMTQEKRVSLDRPFILITGNFR